MSDMSVISFSDKKANDAELRDKSINWLVHSLIPSDFVRLGQLCGVLSVNTQARRFGPLLYLLERIRAGSRVERNLESLPLEDLAQMRDNMRAYQRSSGELSPKRSSVQHYLDLARDIGLVVSQGSRYSLTPHGRLVAEHSRSPKCKPYPISEETRRLLLAMILRTDFVGMQAVVSVLLSGFSTLSSLVVQYRDHLLATLTRLRIAADDAHIKRLAQDRIIGIRRWNKPVKYSEHLVSARLYWLAELELVRLDASREVRIHYDSHSHDWFAALHNASVPTAPVLCEVVATYPPGPSAVHVVNEAITGDKRQIACGVLDDVFRISVSKVGVQKVRSEIIAIYLMACRRNVLQEMASSEHFPFGNRDELQCGTWRYSLHTAPRSSQSYIIRRTEETKR